MNIMFLVNRSFSLMCLGPNLNLIEHKYKQTCYLIKCKILINNNNNQKTIKRFGISAEKPTTLTSWVNGLLAY